MKTADEIYPCTWVRIHPRKTCACGCNNSSRCFYCFWRPEIPSVVFRFVELPRKWRIFRVNGAPILGTPYPFLFCDHQFALSFPNHQALFVISPLFVPFRPLSLSAKTHRWRAKSPDNKRQEVDKSGCSGEPCALVSGERACDRLACSSHGQRRDMQACVDILS